MTKESAVRRAAKLAMAADEERYVVYDCGDYHVASEEDYDTIYAGASVVVEVHPDGSAQYFF